MSSATNQRVLSATTIGRSVVDQEDLKPCWKSEKDTFLETIKKTITVFTSFSKT